MAFSQAKARQERLRMREKKKLSFGSIPTQLEIGNFKKIEKKLKKHKYVCFSRHNGTG